MEPNSPISTSLSSSFNSSSNSHYSLSSSFSSTSSTLINNNAPSNLPGGTPSIVYDSKVVLLGCSDVGKSAMSIQYVSGFYQKRLTPTIGASFQSKLVSVNGKKIKFLIWDSAGQERFRSLTPMYYRGACVAIIVYDITLAHTFDNVKSWVEELKQNIQEDIILVICGNKLDLKDNRMIKTEYAKQYADDIKAMYYETSAKTGENIDQMFLDIAKRILHSKELLHQQLLQQKLLQQQKCNLLQKQQLQNRKSKSFFNNNNSNSFNAINGNEYEDLENDKSSQCCS